MSDPCFVTPLPPKHNHVARKIKVWIASCLDDYVHCVDDLVARLSKGERNLTFSQHVWAQDAADVFRSPKVEFARVSTEIAHMLELNPIGDRRPNQKMNEFVLKKLRSKCEEGVIATSR